MDEVSRQIQPIHDWQLAFWSNGSGRPPGFFQTRIKADDERYGRLEKELARQGEIADVMDDFVKTSNTRQKENEEHKRKREFRQKLWIPIAATIILGLVGWMYHLCAPVAKILWDDYLKSHPIASEQLKHSSYSQDSVYAKSKDSPQDAGNSAAFTFATGGR